MLANLLLRLDQLATDLQATARGEKLAYGITTFTVEFSDPVQACRFHEQAVLAAAELGIDVECHPRARDHRLFAVDVYVEDQAAEPRGYDAAGDRAEHLGDVMRDEPRGWS